MILNDCEVDGVTSVGADNLSKKIGNISKWHGGQNQNGQLNIDAEMYSGATASTLMSS